MKFLSGFSLRERFATLLANRARFARNSAIMIQALSAPPLPLSHSARRLVDKAITI